jgi:transcription factor WhiB
MIISSVTQYPAFLANPVAACKGVDPDLFTAPDGERNGGRRRRVRKAKAICAVCPLRRECLAWGHDREQTGVWGGEDLINGWVVGRARRYQPWRWE